MHAVSRIPRVANDLVLYVQTALPTKTTAEER